MYKTSFFHYTRLLWLYFRRLLQFIVPQRYFDFCLVKIGFFRFKSKFFRTILQLPGDISFICRPDDEKIIKEIFEYGVYACAEISKGDIVVDVGANIGVFTVYAVKKKLSGRVIAIEPAPLNWDLFYENVRRNHLQNVKLYKCAISDHEGMANLYFPGDHSCYTLSASGYTVTSIPVKLQTLDVIFEKENLSICHLLKIDVEGHELHVLKGAKKMLAATHHVVMELHKKNIIVEQVVSFLQEQGFNCTIEWEGSSVALLYAKSSILHKSEHFT